jgi:hypothetical protein
VIIVEKLERGRAIVGKGLTVREAAARLKVGKTALYESVISGVRPRQSILIILRQMMVKTTNPWAGVS